jgi:succinate dehydrogenase / fumarate reductase, flavoprotein subunit
MARSQESLKKAIDKIRSIKKEFWSNVRIPGDATGMNVELEKANRLADFIEIGELMAIDALNREESCGGHFREEFQTEDGEAKRQDDKFAYVGCWEYKGDNQEPELHKEELQFVDVKLIQRNYK